MVKEIDKVELQRDNLEKELDLAVWGRELEDSSGVRPSRYSYADKLYSEEIELDPQFAERLGKGREIQREIRELDKKIDELREEEAMP